MNNPIEITDEWKFRIAVMEVVDGFLWKRDTDIEDVPLILKDIAEHYEEKINLEFEND